MVVYITKCFVSDSEIVDPAEAKPHDFLFRFIEFQICPNVQTRQALYAEVNALVEKPSGSEIWGGGLWRNVCEDILAQESPEPSEFAEEALLFPVRVRTSAALEDAADANILPWLPGW